MPAASSSQPKRTRKPPEMTPASTAGPGPGRTTFRNRERRRSRSSTPRTPPIPFSEPSSRTPDPVPETDELPNPNPLHKSYPDELRTHPIPIGTRFPTRSRNDGTDLQLAQSASFGSGGEEVGSARIPGSTNNMQDVSDVLHPRCRVSQPSGFEPACSEQMFPCRTLSVFSWAS